MGGVNLYQYAPNPVGWVDHLGLAGFFNKSTYQASGNGTSNNYTVFQHKDIEWDKSFNKKDGGTWTNLERAEAGKAPLYFKNGKYAPMNLHHSKQNSQGPLFEFSEQTHQKYNGSKVLHPYGKNERAMRQSSSIDCPT